MSYLSAFDIHCLNFKSIGKNVKISDKASFYGTHNISIGDNVRIDDFCVLSAGSEIIICSNIHIAVYVSMIGKGLIELHDFCQVAARCNILSSCDDFSGEYLVGPCIDEKYTNVYSKPVILGRHSILGVGTVVMPGVTLYTGAIAGAMSFVKQDIPAFEVWAGNPLRFLKSRKTTLLEYENCIN